MLKAEKEKVIEKFQITGNSLIYPEGESREPVMFSGRRKGKKEVIWGREKNIYGMNSGEPADPLYRPWVYTNEEQLGPGKYTDVDSEQLDSWTFVSPLGAPPSCPVPWTMLLVNFIPPLPWVGSEPHSCYKLARGVSDLFQERDT